MQLSENQSGVITDKCAELCKLAGIDEKIRQTTYKGNQRIDEVKKKWELVGTHSGRRTFIVNALSLGIPADVVMKWTGHADYKSMRPYQAVARNIERFPEEFDNLKSQIVTSSWGGNRVCSF